MAQWLREHRDVQGVEMCLQAYIGAYWKFSPDLWDIAWHIREEYESGKLEEAGIVVPKDGMYYKPETEIVYKVTQGKCEWRRASSNRWSNSGDIVGLATDLAKGEVFFLSTEIAKEIGLTTGICCVCGKELTDAKSKELGMGPTCRKMMDKYQEQDFG
jgi:hypothetical protein